MPKGVAARSSSYHIAAIIFFFAWLICGCGAETMLDSPASGAITLIAVIVLIACANALNGDDDK